MSTIVLHNLPVGCMESDIHRALLIYGTAVNIEMDARNSQAVVTMRTQQEAQALLNRHSVNVSGTSVRVDTQQSQPPPPPPQSMGAGRYPYPYPPSGAMYPGMVPSSSAPPTQSYYPPNTAGGYHNAPANTPTGNGSAIMPAPPQTTRRLKVVVEDCRYPITREVLVRMFSMIAPPVSVSCGPYGPTTTGMVEFAEVAAAQQAVEQFHGKAIYPECCYVRLMYAPMWEVPPASGPGVNRTPPAMDTAGYPYAGPGGNPMSYNTPPPPPNADIDARYPAWDPRDHDGAGSSGYDERYYGGSRGYGRGDDTRFAASAARGRGRGFPYNDDDERRDYVGRGRGRGGEGPHSGLLVRGGGGAVRGRGAPLGFSPYSVPPLPAHRPLPARGGAADESAGLGMGGRPPVAPTTDCAVLVSGVAESVPLYDLWVLLEVYGNVKSLKRQHTDRTQVVAQFQHATDTVLAVQYLHGCPFRGSKLRVKRFLGYQERETEWNLGRATDPSTTAVLFEKEYHHRVSPHTPRNPRSAMYPDKNLFFSNLTDSMTEAELEELWGRAGFEPVSSYRRGPKTAIVSFKNIETAVDVLVALHLQEFKGHTLYVTFSRFPPGPRQPTLEHDDAHGDAQDEEKDEDENQGEDPSEAPPADEPVPVEVTDEVDEDGSVDGGAEETKAAPKAGKHKGRPAKK
ncbi:putative RNA-binding protein [Leptomonas pyrrhocoris]|uniref:Putative RNA-binding protein n=1 Tax=Leptomonas pyrrhocoris TaxID=157538 RepID=A0A0M9G8F8_LEPPY|nr:putative RNA-binding protein [Leptomonas pyrrhocoris]KPA84599.1 putative RNA-binding protein [Leptomonas pyrrhocoris]|eukprot:XP_015663038.1 putative RNA-binding protein [Leptomonas pyrrhocoris]